jgi:hypothetical protein
MKLDILILKILFISMKKKFSQEFNYVIIWSQVFQGLIKQECD